MGKLSKQTFKHFVESECDRRLFLDLGRDDPRWLAEPRALVRRTDLGARMQNAAMRLGVQYEARVFNDLCHTSPDAVRCDRAPGGAGTFVMETLSPALLEAYAAELRDGPVERLCLIEHQFEVPATWPRRVFDLDDDDDADSPVLELGAGLRPDLLLLEPATALPGPVVELTAHGATRRVPPNELAGRVAVRIVDVKHTHEQQVGASHFVELLVYAHALTAWLAEHDLGERFVVPLAGHGIFPRIETHAGLSVAALDAHLVELVWDHTAHLYTRIVERIRALHAGLPRAIEDVEVHVRAGCGRCVYLEDCKQSLGMGSADSGQWDVRLMPYTSRSIGQQLRAQGICTVRDVVERLESLPPSPTPQPLDAERPVVLLKAHALLRNERLESQPQYTGGERHLSVALPRFTNLELVFDVETDPTHDIVFAAALDLTISSSPGLSWGARSDAWWTFWREAIDAGTPTASLDWPRLEAMLDRRALELELHEGQPLSAEQRGRLVRSHGAAFHRALRALVDEHGVEVHIALPGETWPGGSQVKSASARVTWTWVSDSPDLAVEANLARALVARLHDMIALCHVCEQLLGDAQRRVWDNGKIDESTFGPTFAGFYWSTEQLDHVEQLLERHVQTLVHDEALRQPFLDLLHWVAPADSQVSHPLRHKKVFDLRTYVETSLGLPRIINYSWHELAADALGHHYKRAYWAPHFNYMDFAPWHQMVTEGNIHARMAALTEINQQIHRKVTTLHRLLWTFRSRQAPVSTLRRTPERTSTLRTPTLGPSVHPLARAWYTYTRLNATTAELAADALRTTYPSYAIGKLAAARVDAIATLHAGDGRVRLELRGLSSHIKLKPNDRVSLVPEAHRGDSSKQLATRWQLTVEAITWLPDTDAGVVVDGVVGRYHPLRTGEPIDESEPWYLYGGASDAWSGVLLELLRRRGLGTAWLGHRLAAVWGVGTAGSLSAPAQWQVDVAHLYAYAPRLLEVCGGEGRPVETSASPTPDASQRAAIEHALSRVVSCLQGPPGTGKSQTIAALIDAFLSTRDGRPTKILVTAFSYPALEVVCEKLARSRDAAGAPTRAAQQTMLFARSRSRGVPAVVSRLGGRVHDLTVSSKALWLDGEKLERRGGKRLESYVGDSFVVFANAWSLAHLGRPSQAKSRDFELVGDGFGFDLVIVDEASQLPVDQLLASLALVHRHEVEVACPGASTWPTSSRRALDSLEVVTLPAAEALTKVVIVGDHQQLPPVQQVKPPRNLRNALDSVFRYYVDGHGLPTRQLQVNYRSLPEIVAFTRDLELYEHDIESFHGLHPEVLERLGPVPASVELAWCRQVLDPGLIVGALIHDREFDTAVSPLEAEIVSRLVEGFYRARAVDSPQAERAFWREELGIVSPHNAHGRLLIRSIVTRLTAGDSPLTCLSVPELVDALSSTIYSVEKFQGSDRTFIIASIGLSSLDQLAGEEEFIYDLNRFNVLTSRAKQKMLLVCSRNFLDYVPRDREVMAAAARIRRYAMGFCDTSARIEVCNEHGDDESVELRWTSVGESTHVAATPEVTLAERVTEIVTPPASDEGGWHDEVVLALARRVDFRARRHVWHSDLVPDVLALVGVDARSLGLAEIADARQRVQRAFLEQRAGYSEGREVRCLQMGDGLWALTEAGVARAQALSDEASGDRPHTRR